MPITTDHVIIFLEVLTFLLLILALYHVIFVVVGLRRIIKRVDNVTQQIEELILKPISMADATVDWMASFLEAYKEGASQKKQKKEKVKKEKK